MIRAIFWKEWREHRWKYISYWLALHAPLILFTLAVGLSAGGRAPFADLSDALVTKYLPLALVQSIFSVTIFLLVTAYLAVATFGPEIEDGSLFFIYEQPVSRRQYVLIKLLNGAFQVVLATCSAILLLPVAAYVMMLLSGKVTMAGSSGTFALVMAAAGRSAVWCSLAALVAFMASVLIAALIPRWWLAAVCSVLITAGGVYAAPDSASFFPNNTESMSVGMSLSTGNSQWITISRAVTAAELKSFAPWNPWPLLIAALLTAAFCAAIVLLYERKQLR